MRPSARAADLPTVWLWMMRGGQRRDDGESGNSTAFRSLRRAGYSSTGELTSLLGRCSTYKQQLSPKLLGEVL